MKAYERTAIVTIGAAIVAFVAVVGGSAKLAVYVATVPFTPLEYVLFGMVLTKAVEYVLSFIGMFLRPSP